MFVKTSYNYEYSYIILYLVTMKLIINMAKHYLIIIYFKNSLVLVYHDVKVQDQ